MVPSPETDVRNSVASSDAAYRSNGTPLQRQFYCSILVQVVYLGFCLTLAAITYLRQMPTFDRYLSAGPGASLRYFDSVLTHDIARAEFDANHLLSGWTAWRSSRLGISGNLVRTNRRVLDILARTGVKAIIPDPAYSVIGSGHPLFKRPGGN